MRRIRIPVTTLLRRLPARSVRPTVAFRRLRQSQLGAQLRFSLSSSAKHMTPTYPRYRSSEGCSSSGTEPSLLAQKDCHMPISTKKKPPTGRGPRWLKPGSIPTLRGDALLPSV